MAQGRYDFDPHLFDSMNERDISMRQVLTAAREGQLTQDPWLDEYGDWRCKLRKRVAGKLIRVAVALESEGLLMASKETGRKGENLYHYRECGLDNIYLVNGVYHKTGLRGIRIHIENLDGLHCAIGRMLVDDKKRLNGRELRFLRHELNLTQENLAALLFTDPQSVARWEKGKTKVPGPADRLIRLLYKEHVNGNEAICEPLRKLAELDELMKDEDSPPVMFEESKNGWEAAEYAA